MAEENSNYKKERHAEQNRTENRTEQNREQNRTEQNRAEQNRTEQNRTEQNKTEQNRTEHRTEQKICFSPSPPIGHSLFNILGLIQVQMAREVVVPLGTIVIIYSHPLHEE
jgi:chromatin remodeling complex protein RSC6